MGFAKVMASPLGRGLRVLAGLALIVAGIAIGVAGWVLAVVGLVPLIAGIADVCLFDPLFGKPLRGRDVRAA